MSAKNGPDDPRRAASPSGASAVTKTHSVRSQRTQHSSSLRQPRPSIVTSPPWSRDEPPTPDDDEAHPGPPSTLQPPPSQSALSMTATTTASASATSHNTAHAAAASGHATQKDDVPWWTFTRRGRQEGPPQRAPTTRAIASLNWTALSAAARSGGSNASNGNGNADAGAGAGEKEKSPGGGSEKPGMRERARTMFGVRHYTYGPHDGADDNEGYDSGPEGLPRPSNTRRKTRGLHIPLPTPSPFTLAQTRTPGWDTPWSPTRGGAGGGASRGSRSNTSVGLGQGSNLGVRDYDQLNGGGSGGTDDADTGRKRSKWYYRRKRIRGFIVSNGYVPLLFRVINLTLTTAALAVAITIRKTERKYNILGAVGSSPILVIIFAPPTLVHVMLAIYLEYFGRPLGLWRTSSKLFHTLSEMLFICAWSAALSLCFDNYFTSVLLCVPASSIGWFSSLPRIIPDVPNLGHGPGEPGNVLCHDQVALICLVFLGLVMYCSNLCISLFRIFEKVKYHPASVLPQ